MTNEPTKIPSLLQRLSEVQPDVCRRVERMGHPDYYIIGNYRFWYSPIYFVAQYGDSPEWQVTGRPALAWLRDAVEAAIEAAGLDWRLERTKSTSFVLIVDPVSDLTLVNIYRDTSDEAMLTALVEWAEGVKGREVVS